MNPSFDIIPVTSPTKYTPPDIEHKSNSGSEVPRSSFDLSKAIASLEYPKTQPFPFATQKEIRNRLFHSEDTEFLFSHDSDLEQDSEPDAYERDSCLSISEFVDFEEHNLYRDYRIELVKEDRSLLRAVGNCFCLVNY
jgi:hypothetical protein